jgi:ribosomal protein S18 acetylase RimI-like enzyme
MKAVNGAQLHFARRQRNREFIISKWTKIDPPDLYSLEEKTWAPWLRKPLRNFETITKLFSDGQRKITNTNGDVVAMISTNRINWDGSIASLSTWDYVAGGSISLGDFSNTYIPDGNTLNIMSISVAPEMQGKGLATILFREIIDMAEYFGVEHLICSFRPSGYGKYKLESGPISIAEYCRLTKEDGLPWDSWLRIATRYGMVPLRIENAAITVEVAKSQFEEYRKTFNKYKWSINNEGKWECGEAGTWTINGDKAIYSEPNLWSEIPIR